MYKQLEFNKLAIPVCKARYRYHETAKVFFREHTQGCSNGWRYQVASYLWSKGFYSDGQINEVDNLPVRLGQLGYRGLEVQGYHYCEPNFNPSWTIVKAPEPKKSGYVKVDKVEIVVGQSIVI